MSARPAPVDAADRELISRSGLDTTLFVEAGAGTGKTTQLVDRIVNTVVERDVALVDIAAITFTEAAASELQARIRIAFEQRAADESTSPELRERCRQAIVDADRASISTVHGFASRILSEFAISARLPPRVTVLDEVSSQLAHERRWERFVDRLHADPANEELLYRAAVLDIPLTERYSGQASFKQVAAAFAQNWDRLVDVDLSAVGEPLADIDFEPFADAVDRLAEVATVCTDRTDILFDHIQNVCLPEMREVVAIDDPYRKLRRFVGGMKWGRGRGGKKGAWPHPVAEIKDCIDAVNGAAAEVRAAVTTQVLERLWRLTAHEVLDAARSRRNDGGLEFHDLLVLARTVLRESADVRRSLHERYRHILLDEFQDTDPIQIEVASLIAAEPSDAQPLDWREHVVPDGGLFFVGDPKQSIYRFRRADIELFLSARSVFGSATRAGGDSVRLTTNFRTVGPIIDWVNQLFAEAMPEEIPGAQPRYEALQAWRQPETGNDHRPIVFGGAHEDPKVKATPLREAEAADVAAIIADVRERPERWPVWSDSAGTWRPARLDDVTILIPTRTSLPYLRDALDGAALPYRLATGTLVYDTQEVRDALALLRAVDDPGDTLSLITALRSPLYGCSDVDLVTYHRAQRTWALRDTAPDGLSGDHPVVVALAHLHSLWSQRWWMSPATLLERALRERRAFLVGLGDPRPIEVWRRLRFLLDQARMFEESVGGDLRAFLDWSGLQSADGARVHEPLLPETDENAARILTVHGAKGLEFPITILAGMTTQSASSRRGVSVVWNDDGSPEVKVRKDVATLEHEPRADLEAEMDQHEKLRLLYVAATRARDHLLVSGHHKASNDQLATFATRLGLFAESRPDLVRSFDESVAAVAVGPDDEDQSTAQAARASGLDAADSGDGEPVLAEHDPSEHADPLASRAAWIARRVALLGRYAAPTALSATAIAATVDSSIADVDDDTTPLSLDADADDDDDAPRPIRRRRGRAGSAIGSAVHATLEVVDFDRPGDLRPLIDRQCDLESIPDHAETVEALVRSALGSSAVALAAQHRHEREMYVAVPLGDVVVEGYIDLLVHGPDGLIVVDYKTDTVATEREIQSKVATYELQAATYAVALELATGVPVVECRFVFCGTGEAIERSVDDLDDAMERVRRTVVDAATPAGAAVTAP